MKLLGLPNQISEITNFLQYSVGILEVIFLLTNKKFNNGKWLLSIFFHSHTYLCINLCICLFIDLTPNVDNSRDIHAPLRGNVNLEVSFKEATENTITVIMYTATSGGISVGKDFDVQLMSSDY